MNLLISRKTLNKVNYFLNAFPKREWSGPAWYLANASDEHGFPEEIEILDFHPLDLGDTSSTEWDAEDLAKILKAKYKENSKLKKCYTGLIHSHHTMGSFFSGTDNDTIKEMAPEKGFYGSLIVSTKVGQEYSFAISYKDQYKRITKVEGDVEIEGIKAEENKEWKAIAKTIEDKAKTTTYAPVNRTYWTNKKYDDYGHYGYGNYGMNQLALAGVADEEDTIDEEVLQDAKDIWSKFKNPQNTMDYAEMLSQMTKLGIDNPYRIFGGTGWTY